MAYAYRWERAKPGGAWVMVEIVTTCPGCGAEVRQLGGLGRPRVYCSGRCRMREHRSRSAERLW